MNGIVYNLETDKILLVIPNVTEVGNDFLIGENASAKGVDLTKAKIIVVKEDIKEGNIIDPTKLVDKSESIKSPLQQALDRIATLEKEIVTMKNDITVLKTAK